MPEGGSGQPVPLPSRAVVPTKTSSTRGELAELIQHAEETLRGVDSSPFSSQAFRALQDRVSLYVVELISESAREAKRQQLDTVSETHVERASDNLFANSGRKIYRHVGTLGGVLLGASISNLLSMAASSTVTFASVALTTALGVIGSFAIALHIARD